MKKFLVVALLVLCLGVPQAVRAPVLQKHCGINCVNKPRPVPPTLQYWAWFIIKKPELLKVQEPASKYVIEYSFRTWLDCEYYDSIKACLEERK